MGDEYNLLEGSANRKSAACLETPFSNTNEESSSILSENDILLLSRYNYFASLAKGRSGVGRRPLAALVVLISPVKTPDHLHYLLRLNRNSMRGFRLPRPKINKNILNSC